VSATWYLINHDKPEWLPHMEPFYPGCIASGLIWAGGLLARRRS
jgi:hypothetical protein